MGIVSVPIGVTQKLVSCTCTVAGMGIHQPLSLCHGLALFTIAQVVDKDSNESTVENTD